MEPVRIHTGLDQFLALDSISAYSDQWIVGEKLFQGDAPYLAIEATAQLSCYHLRLKVECQKQVFLLKMIEFKWHNAVGVLSGAFTIRADQKSESDQAALYAFTGTRNGTPVFQGQVMVAMTDEIDGSPAKAYYQNALKRLLKPSPKRS